MKKLFSVLMAMILCVMLLPISAWAYGTTYREVVSRDTRSVEWVIPNCIGITEPVKFFSGDKITREEGILVCLLDADEAEFSISLQSIDGLPDTTEVIFRESTYFNIDGKFQIDDSARASLKIVDRTLSSPYPMLGLFNVYFEFKNEAGESLGSEGFTSILILTPSTAVECMKTGGYKDIEIPGLTELILAAGFSAPTLTSSGNATSTVSKVSVNGAEKSFEAYNIDGNNYFKLRDLAYVLNGTGKQFDVGYDNATKAITLTTGKKYIPAGGELAKGDGKAKAAVPTASKIYLDGKELNLNVYTIGGNNFFKLRDLMKAINVYVGYDNATKNISIDTSKSYVD